MQMFCVYWEYRSKYRGSTHLYHIIMIMPEFSNDYFILMGMKIIRRYDSSEIHATQIALPFSFKLNVSTKNIF